MPVSGRDDQDIAYIEVIAGGGSLVAGIARSDLERAQAMASWSSGSAGEGLTDE